MLLTLYYIFATYLQAYRIRTICSKIGEKLAEKASVVFYKVPNEVNDMTSALATSDLCTNRSHARISDILWLRGNQRGCSLVPVQNVHLGPWVSFPDPPNLLPFDFGCIDRNDEFDEENSIHLLLETDIVPNQNGNGNENVLIEEYGKPLAWKVDSHFAVLLESDVHHFTKLVMSTFMQDNCAINDHLPLLRIESVNYEGEPQPYDLLKNHLCKQLTSRAMRHLSLNEWEKHLSGLRSISILANQATEFEYNKNRTEGKTGIVKPDLIPSKNIDDDVDHTKSSPIKKLSPKRSPGKIEAKISPIRHIEPEKKIMDSNECLQKPKHSIKNTSPVKNVTSESTLNNPQLPELVNIKIPSSKESEPISANKDNVRRPILVRNKGSLSDCKPPNVLVYSESASTRDNVISTLKSILEIDMYTIYPLTEQQAQQKIWMDNTCLLIICGTVSGEVGELLLDYFLKGGKMLSLCSDILNIVLPTYRTAEVREHELVQFSYDKWQKVKMMHHIFCYQPSPVKKHFSHDGEEPTPNIQKKPALVCPRSVEVKDLQGDLHSLDVKVLGIEETWNTPSLLLANNMKSGGKAVFSQVHLEADPSQFESDEIKYSVLKNNNKARLEIFSDLLKSHLGVNVQKIIGGGDIGYHYANAYFLGRHESKFELLEKLKSKMEIEKMIKTTNLNIKFCGKGEQPPKATSTLLPILIHSCPEDFSTVDYFDNLKSEHVGRIVIYAPILTSSMHVITELTLTHGIAVIPRRQTAGSGRSNNQWLSPDGCVMFSIQLHIPLDTVLGQRIPLVQHLIATAIVHSIIKLEGYENLDIGVKWPNDIYANGVSKIGGLIVLAQMNENNAICNIGCAINLNNSSPTTCVNDIIKDYNRSVNKNLPILSYEKTLANMFSEIEGLIENIQNGGISQLYELYYRYWLHGNQEITIMNKMGEEKNGKVLGIDNFGYLEVQTTDGRTESVQPDGNSFDMLRGLILPK